MAGTIEELQLYAEASDVPWIVTTQMGDSTETWKDPKPGVVNAGKVRYGKEWLINPDLVIIMSQTEVQRELAQMELHIHKVREGTSEVSVPYIVCNWDLDSMCFTEISEDSLEDEESELVF